MIQRRFKTIAALTAVLAALQTAACSPIVATRGNMLPPSKLEKIQPQVSLRADVENQWGPPTVVAPFDSATWYYIGERTSQQGVFPPKVEERQIVKVTFDDMNVVTEVVSIDPALGQDVEIVDRRTPTAGREFTALEQFVSNLGKFNQNIQKKSSIPK